MAPLKVYRTPAGFDDALVAATSQKAALKAWGARGDLFALGEAEVVTDAALTAEPLAHPGQVFRRARGGGAAELKPAHVSKLARARTRKPPDRSRLDAAEAALANGQAELSARASELDAERRDLDAKAAKLTAETARSLQKLEAARDRAKAAYDKASN